MVLKFFSKVNMFVLCLKFNCMLLLFCNRLVIAARTKSKLEETSKLCQKYTPHVYSVVADVSKEQDCKKIIDVAANQLEGFDILILNAALSYPPSWFAQFDRPVSYINYH